MPLGRRGLQMEGRAFTRLADGHDERKARARAAVVS